MSDTYELFDTVRPGRQFLPAGDNFELEFSPQAGPVTADVGTLSSAAPPERDPETGRFVTVHANVLIQLFRPGSHAAVRTRRVSGNVLVSDNFAPLVHDVSTDRAGGTWRCRYTNDGPDLRLRPSVEFVSQVLQVQRTPIPLRVLNHGLAQLLRAIDLRIHLDGADSSVDVSGEFKKLTSGAVRRQAFDVPHVRDVNLSTLDVRVVSPLHTRRGQATWGPPAINLRLQFETKGEELDTTFVDVDLESAVLFVNLGLAGDFDRRGRPTGSIRFTPTTRVGARGSIQILFVNLGITPNLIDDVNAALLEAVREFLTDAQPVIGEYLARDLAQVCGYGHRFVDVSSDATSLIVTHYATDTGPPPSFSLLDTPITLQDTLAASRGDRVGLANLDKIDNIVVLVQENRSFDHLLGYLRNDLGRMDVDGLTGTESNTAQGRDPVTVHPLSGTVFGDDPPHDYEDVLLQIGDGAMDGFLASFIARHPGADFRSIMGYQAQRHLPTFDFLANQFLICDRWFCPHPGPTQPNRMSLVLGGRIPDVRNLMADSSAIGFLALPTWFELLSNAGVDWVYYEHDVSFLRLFDAYRLDDANIVPFDDPREGFAVRAAAGTLPRVTFIEPSFINAPPAKPANDDHPPTDLRHGQDMIACVYNALVSSPQWERTMFVITYDEHGGFYDHVAPPGTPRSTIRMTVPPIHPAGPSFYGPRVPAFVVSPWVAQGGVDNTVFDHTSIAKTIALKYLRRRQPSVSDSRTPYPTMDSRRLVRAAHLGRLLAEPAARPTPPRLPATCPPAASGFRRTPPSEGPGDFHAAMRRLGQPKLHRP